jgi:hypothetical protein
MSVHNSIPICSLLPEDLPPCHGLGRLFTGSSEEALVPSLLACCRRCPITRECAQIAIEIERPLTSSVTGVWGGVYVSAPRHRSPRPDDQRVRALAQLQAVADQPMSVAR